MCEAFTVLKKKQICNISGKKKKIIIITDSCGCQNFTRKITVATFQVLWI